jgi:hypothetical protein
MHYATSASQAAKCKVLLSRKFHLQALMRPLQILKPRERRCSVAGWFVRAFQTPAGACKQSHAAVFNLHRS